MRVAPSRCVRPAWNDAHRSRQPPRFRESYWEHIRPADGSYLYFAGDGARRNSDGYFVRRRRRRDQRVGPSPRNVVESALVSRPAVAEAAVVGRPDDLKVKDRGLRHPRSRS